MIAAVRERKGTVVGVGVLVDRTEQNSISVHRFSVVSGPKLSAIRRKNVRYVKPKYPLVKPGGS